MVWRVETGRPNRPVIHILLLLLLLLLVLILVIVIFRGQRQAVRLPYNLLV